MSIKTDLAPESQISEAIEKPTILIVDDSRLMRYTLKKILADDFKLVEAVDGEDGWQKLLDESHIQGVFSDLSMPNLDGYGLLERIRNADDPKINKLPFIVITGKEGDDQSLLEEVLAHGGNDVVSKPFKSEDIIGKTKSFLAAKSPSESAKNAEIPLKDDAAGALRRAEEDAEVHRKAQEEAVRCAAVEDEAERRAEQEAEVHHKAQEEANHRVVEEAEAERRAEQEAEAHHKAKEEANRRIVEEAEAERRAEQEAAAHHRAQEEAVRRAAKEAEAERRAEQEAEAHHKAQEEANRRAAEEAEAKRRAEQEAESHRKAQEETARRAAEEAKARRLAEQAETQRQAEQAARQAAEEAARRAEEQAEAQRREAEAEAQRQAEQAARQAAEEATRRAEEQAEAQRREAEAEAQRQAEQAARQAAEEATRRAEEQAEAQRREAEAEAQRQAEQAARQAAEETTQTTEDISAQAGYGDESQCTPEVATDLLSEFENPEDDRPSSDQTTTEPQPFTPLTRLCVRIALPFLDISNRVLGLQKDEQLAALRKRLKF